MARGFYFALRDTGYWWVIIFLLGVDGALILLLVPFLPVGFLSEGGYLVTVAVPPNLVHTYSRWHLLRDLVYILWQFQTADYCDMGGW